MTQDTTSDTMDKGHHKSTNGQSKMKRQASEKEEQKLEELKSNLMDLLTPEHDDFNLRKWLKARCFDVAKAEKMFRDSMEFREKMKVDRLLQDYTPPKVLQEYLTGGFCGYDKEGSPVRVERYGYLDMKGLMCSTRKSDLEKTKMQQNERIVDMWSEQSKKLGRRVDGLTVIFDMENAGTKHMWRPGLQMYMHMVKLLEDNYPEMMKRLMVVNAPKIFPVLWKLGRPLVSDDMKAKIFVLGSDYIDTLRKYIDDGTIPAYLGGTLTDPDGDPMCRTMICHGGTVPSSYYLSENDHDDSMETVTISLGKKLKIDFEVDIPGSIIRWEFRTDDYDIGFGLVYVKDDKTEEEIVPNKRVNAHQIAHDGTHICEKTGSYAVVFDNKYSWSRDKKLYYSVELFTTDDDTSTEVDKLASGGSWTKLVKGMQITHL